MFQDKNAVANIAVKDLEIARTFYEGTLGLKPDGTEGDQAIKYHSGATPIFVYRSDYAGTNKATALTWQADGDIDNIVRSLKSKGVTFEHYDMPGMKREGDLHIADTMKMAWFKDPDGNILSVVSDTKARA